VTGSLVYRRQAKVREYIIAACARAGKHLFRAIPPPLHLLLHSPHKVLLPYLAYLHWLATCEQCAFIITDHRSQSTVSWWLAPHATCIQARPSFSRKRKKPFCLLASLPSSRALCLSRRKRGALGGRCLGSCQARFSQWPDLAWASASSAPQPFSLGNHPSRPARPECITYTACMYYYPFGLDCRPGEGKGECCSSGIHHPGAKCPTCFLSSLLFLFHQTKMTARPD
jgi:hypothetical protein